jgi:hypothetical protein
VFTVTACFFPGSSKPTKRLQHHTETEDPNVHTAFHEKRPRKCGWKHGESASRTKHGLLAPVAIRTPNLTVIAFLQSPGHHISNAKVDVCTYSSRRVLKASTLVARYAGMMLANRATSPSSSVTAAMVSGSLAATP